MTITPAPGPPIQASNCCRTQHLEQMLEAARENALYQSATELSSRDMLAARDEENCFRVVEVGIPSLSYMVSSNGTIEIRRGLPMRTHPAVLLGFTFEFYRATPSTI